MIFIAFGGIAVNGYAAFKVSKGNCSQNEKVISWHLVEDVVSVGLLLL